MVFVLPQVITKTVMRKMDTETLGRPTSKSCKMTMMATERDAQHLEGISLIWKPIDGLFLETKLSGFLVVIVGNREYCRLFIGKMQLVVLVVLPQCFEHSSINFFQNTRRFTPLYSLTQKLIKYNGL